MATPFNIRLTTANTGLLKYKQTEPVAARASELLQEDLEVGLHHVLRQFASTDTRLRNTTRSSERTGSIIM